MSVKRMGKALTCMNITTQEKGMRSALIKRPEARELP